MSAPFLTVLDSLIVLDIPQRNRREWDAPGQQGGAAVEQRPLFILLNRHRELRCLGLFPGKCVRVGKGVKGRTCVRVGVGCVCGYVVYMVTGFHSKKAGAKRVNDEIWMFVRSHSSRWLNMA